MQQFRTLTSPFILLARNDIDTDQIIPARYLKGTDKTGLGEGLFAGWRYQPDGSPDPDFPLNWPGIQDAQILVAGNNFGCGSSREHAPWALLAWGIRAVVSTSFADIFWNNALKNGLLPVKVDPATQQSLFNLAQQDPGAQLTVDLETQALIFPDGRSAKFPIDPFSKTCLLEGVDQLGYLLKHQSQIEAFERANPLPTVFGGS